ncbi:hypothetical protein B0A52_02163 [Exophiala mesophila]|uniref:Glycosyltransferase family 25 protein n=1 Tax=Exophiala mesophila TaxID=212818 RepID=A0A438NBQ5_EXOME|nr:hypothetical protein B0A52_02163 [Exophiala mesophila]
MSSDGLDDVYNSTLGFQKVFAIGFAERTDKRDAKTLASSFTDIDIDWLPAVSFEQVSPKAAPPTWDFNRQAKGALGCWRAHMNALEHIVRHRIQTALIMEDDADWDVSLKDQLLEFATGTRALQHLSPNSPSPSAYGSEWDFLWLGHCRVGSTDDDQEFWVIDDDSTSPPVKHRWAGWTNRHFPDEVRRDGTRVILNAAGGARKILASVSMGSVDSPVDASLSEMCRGKLGNPLRCYAPYPPLLASHRAAGPQFRDSDLNEKGDKWHKAYTWDIVYSTVLNIPRLVKGLATVKAQWPDHSRPEMLWNSSLRASSKGYLKTIAVSNSTTSPNEP